VANFAGALVSGQARAICRSRSRELAASVLAAEGRVLAWVDTFGAFFTSFSFPSKLTLARVRVQARLSEDGMSATHLLSLGRFRKHHGILDVDLSVRDFRKLAKFDVSSFGIISYVKCSFTTAFDMKIKTSCCWSRVDGHVHLQKRCRLLSVTCRDAIHHNICRVNALRLGDVIFDRLQGCFGVIVDCSSSSTGKSQGNDRAALLCKRAASGIKRVTIRSQHFIHL
jgi:hypothetical protein